MFRIAFSRMAPNEIHQLARQKLKLNPEVWEKNIWDFLVHWFDPSLTAMTVTTSGSTGAPKQITRTKNAALHSAKLTCEALELKPGMKCLLCLPANKISGIMFLVRCIYNRMDVFCVRPSANPLSELQGNIHFDFAAFTPMQVFDIGKNLKLFSRLEKISKVIIGGGEISTPLRKSISLMRNQVFETFGMTETISHIALRKLNGIDASVCFKTLNGVFISANEYGQLIIDAPELEVRHLMTSDVVKLLSPHSFEWLGRTDNIINSGGLKIHPEEIEQKLEGHIYSPFFVGSIPDERTGEQVVLAVEAKTFSGKEKEELVNPFTQIPSVKRPKLVLVFPQFIRTETGKVQRTETLKQNPLERMGL